ncbi:MAG: LemA family protein [Myxococcales bacterium]|nr:MAG: LemA family protein [Myxococcales bacterium]
MGFALVIALLLFAALTYLIIIYNGLVLLRNNIGKTWSNIDVLLKQRYDEVPKLVTVCQAYMDHERQTLEAVTRARTMAADTRRETDIFQASDALSGSLARLFALSENYPTLKADQMFRQLQSRITEIENHIADRRELFNDSVNLYNIRIDQFPDVVVTRLFGFAPRSLWRADAQSRASSPVTFHLPRE